MLQLIAIIIIFYSWSFLNTTTLVNKATIVGRVGQDAEINKVGDRTVVNFSVATSETRKDEEGNLIQTTHWHRIVSWDQFRNPYLSERVHKGDLIYVEGPIHYRAYTAKDGTEKHLTEITLSTCCRIVVHGMCCYCQHC
ncbi:hypothetical protein BC939DRAFT_398062 [Gamsiella multidivaricata]|uniref:uncharacterized protein n=1 Tax=Gamsiella multidivaricata TaxID=101098 RepID=UPI00221F02A1|nr:uncharacterized protein BC939DRAFT_398062 [Gamsiella multidivaricata]KAI7822135.1 hypothetical protein BC939DRAFT_398062 [Gamsiella multidivaricata]